MLIDPHYQAAIEFYKARPETMKIIDDGLKILDHLGANYTTKQAFCIAPLAIHNPSKLIGFNPLAVVLAMDLRNDNFAFDSVKLMAVALHVAGFEKGPDISKAWLEEHEIDYKPLLEVLK